MIFRKLVDSVTTRTPKEYPPLTMTMLYELEEKLDEDKITASDCELLDHYLSSCTGRPGYLKESLQEVGVNSFGRVKRILKNGLWNLNDYTYAEVQGTLLGCIEGLMERLEDGEKIY